MPCLGCINRGVQGRSQRRSRIPGGRKLGCDRGLGGLLRARCESDGIGSVVGHFGQCESGQRRGAGAAEE
eukprot:4580097-Amphidinium_carterae.1